MIGQVELKTPLGNFGTLDVEEGATIQDLYDMAHLNGKPVVCVLNGSPVLRESWDMCLTEEDEMHFLMLPQGGGGDGGKSGLGRALGLLVVAVASFYFGPQVGAALGFGSGAAAAAVGSAIITFTGALLVNAVFPPPSSALTGAQQQSDISPTYNVNAQGNSARYLQPIPRLYGRHVIYPDYAVEPWSTFIGLQQQLRQIFCIGLGEYEIESIRIDDTEIWNSVDGSTIFGNNLFVAIVPPGQNHFNLETWVNAAEITSVELIHNVDGYIGPFIVNRAGTEIEEIAVSFAFPRGLYQSSGGSFIDHTVTPVFEYRQIDDSGNPIGSWTTFATQAYTDDSPQPTRRTHTTGVPAGRYEVRGSRTTAPANDVNFGDTVTWIGLRGQLITDDVYDHETVMYVNIEANDEVAQNYSGRLNVIATAKIPTHDGTNFTANTATKNPAWAALDVLRNQVYGAGLQDHRIDINAFVQLANTATTRVDNFNGVFDSKRSIWDVLTTILASVRAQPIIVGGIITVIRDEQAAIPRGVFTPNNIVANSLEVQYLLFTEDSPDSIIVEFFDETIWGPNEITCALPGSANTKPARIQIFGITDFAQAWREGMHRIAVNFYRRKFATLSVALEGKLLLRGDTVLVNHDLPEWGSSATADFWDLPTRTLTVSQPIPDTATVCGIIDRRNKIWAVVEIDSISENGQTIILDETSFNDAVTTHGPAPISTELSSEPTRLTFGTLETYTQRFKLIEATATSPEQLNLRLNNDDMRVYGVDEGTPPSPGG